MLAKIVSGVTVGLAATPIEVEVDIQQEDLPSFTMVGTQYLPASGGGNFSLSFQQ